MTTTSPWSQHSTPVTVPAPPPAGTLPPAPGPVPPPGIPGPAGFRPPRPPRRPWGWIVLALLLAVGVAAAVGSAITYAATRSDRASTPPPASAGPRFSQADVDAAKQNLCHVVHLSVGQKGQGGYRVQGNLNVPVTLQAVNSAVAVEHALGPAVPPDVASAARKYIDLTLQATTAAMGTTSTSELNRLTNAGNDAIDALLDVCGLSR